MTGRGAGLPTARIAFDADGTPRASDFGDIYHSASGALGQAREVFLAGNGLPARWACRSSFAILETGFGLGVNFLATWQAWRADPQRPARLDYVAVEKWPPALADLRRAHALWPELADLAAALAAAWPPPLAGFHRRHFDAGRVSLTLILGDARQQVPRIEARFDAFYLDGFAPECNPDLWSADLLTDLAWLAAPSATCATYTVARTVREALSTAGFECAKLPGFGTKRHRLGGQLRPGAASPAPSFAGATDTPVVVIGAGIAGIAVAERLTSRGRQVTLLEAAAAPAQGASGNHLAAMLPVLALDETRLARTNRAAFLYALQRLQTLDAAGQAVNWSPCGVLHLPRSAELAARQARIVSEQGLPAEFVRLVDVAEASTLIGATSASGGWWFPQGGWVSPPDLCRALLASAGERLRLCTGAAVAALRQGADGWQALDDAGTVLASAPDIVLAQSHGILSLAQAAHLPLRCFRGQVTHLPAAAGEPPRAVVCGEGYFTPPVDGWRCLGASFERSHDLALRASDHAANLARLQAMLPTLAAQIDAAPRHGRVGLRPVSPDKLPMVGPLPLAQASPSPPSHVEWPRWKGLWLATGYGARGLVWAPLMAELLASQMGGEPLPLEGDLAAAVDPARFIWKAAKV